MSKLNLSSSLSCCRSWDPGRRNWVVQLYSRSIRKRLCGGGSRNWQREKFTFWSESSMSSFTSCTRKNHKFKTAMESSGAVVLNCVMGTASACLPVSISWYIVFQQHNSYKANKIQLTFGKIIHFSIRIKHKHFHRAFRVILVFFTMYCGMCKCI